MTDDTDTLRDAYARLTTALDLPPEHHALVAGRTARLRRRRRTLHGVMVASLTAAAVGAVALVGGTAGQAPAFVPADVPATSSAASAGSAASGADGGPATCGRTPPPPAGGVHPEVSLRLMLRAFSKAEGLGVTRVRFRDEGSATTAYLVDRDNLTVARLRVVGDRVRDLVVCE